MNIQYTKRRCEAMICKGIKDPESHDGINFCLYECPYSVCVVFESRREKTVHNVNLAKKLFAEGKTKNEIAEAIGVTVRTITRYLKV